MAIRKIARMGHPVLYEVAVPVADPTDPEVARLARDMQDTLVDVGGSGLAAPQVFESTRLVVYRSSRRLMAEADASEDAWVVMVNPELAMSTDEPVMGWERCLSIPGLHGQVPRARTLLCSYQTLDGETIEHEATGTLAMLLQHECDHLDGVLYPMRMTDLSQLEFDAEPGQLARDLAAGADVWPLMRRLVDDWPGRETWIGERPVPSR
jgi:peptide deformylase